LTNGEERKGEEKRGEERDIKIVKERIVLS